MRYSVLFLSLFMVFYSLSQGEKAQPRQSFFDIPFSNGFTAVKYSTEKKVIDSYKNHIYSHYDESTSSHNLLESLDFSLTVSQKAMLLSELPQTQTNYINGTGIVKTISTFQEKEITLHYFSPFTLDHPTLLVHISLPNEYSISPIVKLNKEMDYKKIKSNAFFSKKIMEAISYETWESQKNGKKNVLFAITCAPNMKKKMTKKENIEQTKVQMDEIEKLTIEGPLKNELEFWEKWHEKETIPEELTTDEKALWLQSSAILKMGQCREPGAPHGQILASIPPGHWNIAWVRDGAYAIEGLLNCGHYTEAKHALEFILNSQCGDYKTYIHQGKEYGVGADYQVSVCRYYGNGKEESDFNDNGPNLEFDGFGLFLRSLSDYLLITEDTSLWNKYKTKIIQKIGDVVVNHLVCTETGLIRPDSGPWEQHVNDDGYDGVKYFSYTTACNIEGLKKLSLVCGRFDDNDKSEFYEKAAEKMARAFNRLLVHKESKIIKQSMERKELSPLMIDGASVEAINFNIIPMGSPIVENTFQAYDKYLSAPTGWGYRRNNNGNDYDRKEWIVIDLRIANALIENGQKEKARNLISWITNQSKLNFNIIAELYHEETADYAGAVPMCGFGPGAYITTIKNYYEHRE